MWRQELKLWRSASFLPCQPPMDVWKKNGVQGVDLQQRDQLVTVFMTKAIPKPRPILMRCGIAFLPVRGVAGDHTRPGGSIPRSGASPSKPAKHRVLTTRAARVLGIGLVRSLVPTVQDALDKAAETMSDTTR